MKCYLTYICILVFLVIILLHCSFASTTKIPTKLKNNSTEIKSSPNSAKLTFLPTSPRAASSIPPKKWLHSPSSRSAEESSASKVKTHAKGKNMPLEHTHEDVLLFVPTHDNFDNTPDYQQSVFDAEPAVSPQFNLFVLDFDDTADVVSNPVAISRPGNGLRIARPLENRIMAGAARQMVFRPLFAYRRQIAQKRRFYVHSKPSSQNKKAQKRQQPHPYRYPSYGYPRYYPGYYKRAQYDYVA